MGQIIKNFGNGYYLEYDRGSFDDWCVYFTQPNGKRNPPKDIDYFSDLKEIAAKYGTECIYQDYVRVYDMTGKQPENRVLVEISAIAKQYASDSLKVDIILSILYLAMIAEENKRYSRLGKRIKRLGVFLLLMEDQSVHCSANFMRGMKWQEIDKLCKERGF